MPLLVDAPAKTLFTQTEITALAVKVGFPATGLPASPARIMGACDMVEAQAIIDGKNYSDATRVGDLHLVDMTWGPSYSNGQIRSKWADAGTGRTRDGQRLAVDPEFAMYSALQIWKDAGKKFTPWSTFNSEAYAAYLQDVMPPAPDTYIVIGGDSLAKIAGKLSTLTGFTVRWLDLAKVNHIPTPKYTIYPGNKLSYPWTTHPVAKGDTLTRIVNTYGVGVTVAQVIAFNGIADPNKIRVGQIIRLPRQELFA